MPAHSEGSGQSDRIRRHERMLAAIRIYMTADGREIHVDEPEDIPGFLDKIAEVAAPPEPLEGGVARIVGFTGFVDIVKDEIATWKPDTLRAMLDKMTMEQFAAVCAADLGQALGHLGVSAAPPEPPLMEGVEVLNFFGDVARRLGGIPCEGHLVERGMLFHREVECRG